MQCSRQPRFSHLQLKPTNAVDFGVEIDAETALWEKKLEKQRAWIEALPNLDDLIIRRSSPTVSLPKLTSEASVAKINVAHIDSLCSDEVLISEREDFEMLCVAVAVVREAMQRCVEAIIGNKFSRIVISVLLRLMASWQLLVRGTHGVHYLVVRA